MAITGIRWYGLQPDMANGILSASAFGDGGDELSRGQVNRDSSGAYNWSLSDGQARIEASFSLQTDGEEGTIVGEVADTPYILTVTGQLEMDEPVSLGDAEQRLVAQWSAVIPKMEVLFDVFSTGSSSPSASPEKCFTSGFLLPLSIITCPVSGLGCAAAGIFGGYIWKFCTD